MPESSLYAMPPVQKSVLSNRLVLLHSEDHALPFVTLQLLIDAGSGKDPSGMEGLSHLAARGILLGTSGHSAAALSEELDFLGASLDSSSGKDYATLSLRVLRKDLDKGFALFMEALANPTFPEKELKQEVEKTLALIQSQEDQPGEVAKKEFLKTLFLSGPYRYPAIGTKDSLPRLTREEVLTFYKTYYRPNNCILAVVGDITAEEVKNRLIPLLERLPAGDIPEVPVKTVFSNGPATVKIDRKISQANIILGNPGITRGNPDFYALTVMNYILGGGGFASRLVEEVRDKRGLAYSVASFFDPGKYPGSFQVVLQTKNASAREAISLVLQQVKRIREELVSDKELEGAKKYLIGSFPLRIDTQAKLANVLIQEEYYGLGLDYPEKYPLLIKSVTRADVLRVAETYLHPDNDTLIVVGDLKETGMASDGDDPDPVKTEVPSNMAETTNSLIQEVINAYGGKTAVAHVKSVYARGKTRAIISGDEGTYIRYFKRERKLRVDIDYRRSSELRILNGNKGYESIDAAPLSPVTGDRYFAIVYLFRQLDLPFGLLENAYPITYEGKADVNGIEAEVLSVKASGGPPMKVYIDGKTFRIIKVSGFFSLVGTTLVLSAEFADFRKVDGTIFPFKITNFADDQMIAETVMKEYTVNPGINDSLFTPPLQ
jgi:zinc protease